MKKSDLNQPPCYFDRYMNRVADIELFEAFDQSLTELETLNLARFKQVGDAVYATGKWTVKDIFQHLIDAEHILSYRALRIGRNDKSLYTGFDQDLLAVNVSTDSRSLEHLVEALKVLRQATRFLFGTFTDEAMQRFTVVDGKQMSALAFGFTILGHQKYHLRVLAERYLPLAPVQTQNSDK